VGGLAQRLARLEAREHGAGAGGGSAGASEELERQRWLERARYRKRWETSGWKAGYDQVAGVIRLHYLQGRLGATTEELREQLRAWNPPFPADVIERELARYIYYREPGSEAMVGPPEWMESFEKADRLAGILAEASDAALAEWLLSEGQPGEELGLSGELILDAIGPDAQEIGTDEFRRRMLEIAADTIYGPRGWSIKQAVRKLREEQRHG
jgi:hypothetical protein